MKARPKARLKELTILALIILCSGCVENTTVIHLRKDGSGTVVERRLTTRLAEMTMAKVSERIARMQGGEMVDEQGNPVVFPAPDLEAIYDGEQYLMRAEQIGARVKQIKRIKGAGGAYGIEAVYEFDDITQLALNLQMPTAQPLDAGDASNTNLRFRLIPRETYSTLFVEMPKDPPSEEEISKGLEDLGKAESLSEMFQDRDAMAILNTARHTQLSLQMEEGIVLGGNALYVGPKKQEVIFFSVEVPRLLKDRRTVALLDSLNQYKDRYKRFDDLLTDDKADRLISRLEGLAAIDDPKTLEAQVARLPLKNPKLIKDLISMARRSDPAYVREGLEELRSALVFLKEAKALRSGLADAKSTLEWIRGERDEVDVDLRDAPIEELSREEKKALLRQRANLAENEKKVRAEMEKFRPQYEAVEKEAKERIARLSKRAFAVMNELRRLSLAETKTVMAKMPSYIKVEPQLTVAIHFGAKGTVLPTLPPPPKKKVTLPKSPTGLPTLPEKPVIPKVSEELNKTEQPAVPTKSEVSETATPAGVPEKENVPEQPVQQPVPAGVN